MAGFVHVCRERIEAPVPIGQVLLGRLIEVATEEECLVAVVESEHDAVAVDGVRLTRRRVSEIFDPQRPRTRLPCRRLIGPSGKEVALSVLPWRRMSRDTLPKTGTVLRPASTPAFGSVLR